MSRVVIAVTFIAVISLASRTDALFVESGFYTVFPLDSRADFSGANFSVQMTSPFGDLFPIQGGTATYSFDGSAGALSMQVGDAACSAADGASCGGVMTFTSAPLTVQNHDPLSGQAPFTLAGHLFLPGTGIDVFGNGVVHFARCDVAAPDCSSARFEQADYVLIPEASTWLLVAAGVAVRLVTRRRRHPAWQS